MAKPTLNPDQTAFIIYQTPAELPEHERPNARILRDGPRRTTPP